MKKKNRHLMKIARTGETREMVQVRPTPENIHSFQMKEDTPDDQCRLALDSRCQHNLNKTGHPFRHKAADGTIVTPDPTISYYLGRLPMDDQEYIMNMWQQYIKPDALLAVPVDLDWYKKHPITIEDLNGTSGRFHE